MAAYRPRCPVLAVTRDLEVARHMQLYRGILPVYFREARLEDWTEDMDTRIYHAIDVGWERQVCCHLSYSAPARCCPWWVMPMQGVWKFWNTHTHTRLTALYRDYPGEPVSERQANLDFTEASDSVWQWHPLGHMQVCSSLQTDNHTSTPPLSYLQAGCPSCRPTNSVKALKALEVLEISWNLKLLLEVLEISWNLGDFSTL